MDEENEDDDKIVVMKIITKVDKDGLSRTIIAMSDNFRNYLKTFPEDRDAYFAELFMMLKSAIHEDAE